MKVRLKVLLIVVFAGALLLGGMYISAKIFIVGNIERNESLIAQSNIEQFFKLLNNEINSLNSICMDWARWDDAYEFMENKNEEFIESNLVDETFAGYKLGFIIFADNDGNIVYGKGYNFVLNKEIELSKELLSHINKESPILSNNRDISSRSGLLMIDNFPILISSVPITTSTGEGEIRGNIIMGKLLGYESKKVFQGIIGFDISFENVIENSRRGILPMNNEALNAAGLKIRKVDNSVIEEEAYIIDIYGNNILKIVIGMPRIIYRDGVESYKIFLYTFSICMILIMLAVVFFTEKFLIGRLAALDKFVYKVSVEKNTDSRIHIGGNDEISNLAEGINSMLSSIGKSVEDIKYLSYHDQLTGVYNRAYFNDRLKYLEEHGQLPLTIIMGDANGLKLANDAFGHREGDKLLIKVAEILQRICVKSDTIARIGGDEFIVMLQGVDEIEAGRLCSSIRKYCESLDEKPIRPSIALGAATRNSTDEDIIRIIDIAEERMYKNKLLEAHSTRHAIIASLESSLLETDYETREHAERLKTISVIMGNCLNLSNSQIDELSLLSALHDIGKIAVPREILVKASPLNQEEWEAIRKHPEIGYRIALSTPELNSIAEYILYHHEKWDGSGYPRGLKGKEIPLLSRIISIVDAYDVITHSRPYKKALPHEEALRELQRCSGTHFDPELVEVYVNMFNG